MNIRNSFLMAMCVCVSCHQNQAQDNRSLRDNETKEAAPILHVLTVLGAKSINDINIVDSLTVPQSSLFICIATLVNDTDATKQLLIFQNDKLLSYAKRIIGSNKNCGRNDLCDANLRYTNKLIIDVNSNINTSLSASVEGQRVILDSITLFFKSQIESSEYIVSRIFRKKINRDIATLSIDSLTEVILPKNMDSLDIKFDRKYEQMEIRCASSDTSRVKSYSIKEFEKDLEEQGIYEKRIKQYASILKWWMLINRKEDVLEMYRIIKPNLSDSDRIEMSKELGLASQ